MKKLEIAILVLSLMGLAFVFGCEESPAEAKTATLGKNGRYYSPTGHGMPRGYSPGIKMYTCGMCWESFELPEELDGHKVCTRDIWNEKDENGVSNAEHMARTNREYERRAAERKRQAEEAAIEREAEIQARAAMKLIELMSEPKVWETHCPDCGIFCGKWTDEGIKGEYQHKKDCVAPFDIKLMPSFVNRQVKDKEQ